MSSSEDAIAKIYNPVKQYIKEKNEFYSILLKCMMFTKMHGEQKKQLIIVFNF